MSDDATLELGDGASRAFPGRVGPFRLLREVGQGGMGRVFLAEQETPDFRRTAAIKLIDRPGASAEAVRRFRDEVRILASLDHPGIVRFLDGGLSPEEIWYLALEYVEGDDLLLHAERLELDVAERVELVAAVAEAVAFAHARGIIHRDLKPSNVLVGRDGRPRLLDFGISKLLDRDESASLTTTHHAARPLTPAYASPEQLEGESATEASDIYSLGVVLYELLAGERPFGRRARPGPTGEPEPPSAAAKRLATASGRTRRRIGRDLDAICLKALRLDPAERYADSAALAADLRRYLASEPVEARRDGLALRARELVRRHRLVFASVAALAVLAVVAVVALSARRKDGGKPALAASSATPAPFPFDPISPPPAEESESRLAQTPDDFVVGSALAIRLARDRRLDEARIALGRLRQIPGAETDPLVDFAAAEVARRAGEDQAALVFLTRAKENAVAQRRGDLLGTLRLARGSILVTQGQRDAGQSELEAARADLERAGDMRPLYRALNELAIIYFQRGELDRGEATFERAVDAADRGGFEPMIAATNLAEVKLQRGRPDLAEPLARQSLEWLRAHPDPGRPSDALTRLSFVVRDLGRSEEAAAHLDEALALVRDDPGSIARGTAIYARSMIDLQSGRLDRIDAAVTELEAVAEKSLRRRPLGFAREIAARKAALADRLEPARDLFAEARRLFRSEGDRDLAAISDLALAEAEALAGNSAEAARIVDDALADLDQASATLPGYFAETLRARLEASGGSIAAARGRVDALGDTYASSPSVSRRLAYLRSRAAVAGAEGHADDARADLDTALELALRIGRKTEALELGLERARLETNSATARSLASQIEREADTLGLVSIAGRARSLIEPRTPSSRG